MGPGDPRRADQAGKLRACSVMPGHSRPKDGVASAPPTTRLRGRSPLGEAKARAFTPFFSGDKTWMAAISGASPCGGGLGRGVAPKRALREMAAISARFGPVRRMDTAARPHYKPPARRSLGVPPWFPWTSQHAQVAQLVEHATENRSVGGSIPPLGTIRASALIRQRSLSSIMTATSRIFGFAAVRPNFVVSGDFHGIFHGRSMGSWYRDFWVESNRCRSRTTPIFGT